MSEVEFEYCPSCGDFQSGSECDNCGFSYLYGGQKPYETPEGNIVNCTEEEALEEGYISMCPMCGEHIITWWELEDHGMCINCWHRRHIDNNK